MKKGDALQKKGRMQFAPTENYIGEFYMFLHTIYYF